MKTTANLLSLSLFAATLLLLAGCNGPSKQARSIPESEAGVLLKDYSMLHKGEGQEALWVYKDKSADWNGYTKVLVDPVMFQSPPKASTEELADLQKLATNLHTLLVQQLGLDYTIATAPGPGVMRVQTAFFDAETKNRVTHFMSSVIPIGVVVSLSKDFITGKPLSVGEISAELKVTDAQSGTLLAAALDRRVGTQWGHGMFESWATANDAIAFWAKRTRFALCTARGGTDCVAPAQ